MTARLLHNSYPGCGGHVRPSPPDKYSQFDLIQMKMSSMCQKQDHNSELSVQLQLSLYPRSKSPHATLNHHAVLMKLCQSTVLCSCFQARTEANNNLMHLMHAAERLFAVAARSHLVCKWLQHKVTVKGDHRQQDT